VEHLAVFAILVGALALLIFSRVPADGVAIGVIALLILTGTATPGQALSGFSHPATLIVASVLLLSGGIQRTGVVDGLALWMRRRAARSESTFLRLQTAVVAPMSAFISNTAVVGVFLPVVLAAARDRGFSASRLLIPLSYASLLGGVCTLIGTSTNIVVANLAVDHGLAPLRMFDFTPLGLLIAIPGIVYLVYLAPRIIPDRRHGENPATHYHMRRYLTEVEIEPGSHLAGKTLGQSRLSEIHDMDVLEIHRGPARIQPNESTLLEERDTLIVHAPLGAIQRIQDTAGISLRSQRKIDLPDLIMGGMLLAEGVVPPGSPLVGRTLQSASFRNKYGLTALALYHHRQYIKERVGKIVLGVGDVLLLYGSRTRLREMAAYPEVLSVVHVHPPRPRRKLGWVAAAIVFVTVVTTGFGLLDLVHAVVAGAALMLLTGCLTVREAFRSVDRRTIFLLAGMISLAMAMERDGAATYFARHVIEASGKWGPHGLLAVTYLSAMLLTEVLTNNACAAIMTPIAVAAARDSGLDPTPFVFAVAYAASASFLTPIGYQTNMFVYGPGGYRFADFARVGLPLSLIAWGTVTVFAPILWPFHP